MAHLEGRADRPTGPLGELQYKQLFEAATDGMFLLEDSRFVECNARALELFACTREQLLGRSPLDFSPPVQVDGRASEEKVAAMIHSALQQGNLAFEWTHCRYDRTPFECEVTLTRLDLAQTVLLLAIVRDVSERRSLEADQASHRTYLENLVRERTSLLEQELTRRQATEQNLRRSEHILRAVLDSLDAVVYVADFSTYEVLLVNKYVEHHWGDITGKLCWQTLQTGQDGPCPFCTNAKLLDAEGRATGVHVWEFQNTITGTWYQCRDVAIPWLDGRLVRLEIAADITELHETREQAQSADRLKSSFLATMSHELRTPLNSILGFSGIMLQGLAGPLNAEQHHQLGMVNSSAEHLLALINDVLDLSKIEAEQLQLDLAPFDLRASIAKVTEVLRPQLEKKGLTLELALDPDLEPFVSDQRRVEQILLNLLSNGLKFTDRGGLRVEARRAEDRVTISVTDTGLGIQEEEFGNLFKPFSQLDTGINKRHEGTGLGLSISKRLAELLGGTIWVKSTWGRGSTFAIELPLAPRSLP